MCRINGLFQENISESILLKMRDTLAYGGPDDAGMYINENKNIGLCQRRLSIIDLSAGGHQPKFYNNLAIVFNGEIYNYKEITKELEKLNYTFSSGSDTEVVLKAFECWGYDAVHKFRGMFAFAIWNSHTKKLLLCRDRVGVKPLYWYQKDDLFMFASELKAFHEHPAFDKTINHAAVSIFLQTGYIKSPYSIFKYAYKLEPGSFLEIDENREIKQWKYWSVREKYANTVANTKNEIELIKECEQLLTESFQLRMVADVPVGMFLSGGIDSTLVTALLQKNATKPIKTFTIGFDDPTLNEATFAKEIAQYLGTDHTELYCTEKDFEEIIPHLPTFYDEPFGDSSAIPTYLVSKLAKQQVTVSLSADGGDEIFAGYNRYLFSESLHDNFSKLPMSLRKAFSYILDKMDIQTIKKIFNLLPIPANYKLNLDARLPKLKEGLIAKTDLDFLYASTLFITPQNLKELHLYSDNNPINVFDKNIDIINNLKYSAFGVADIESYLEGDILAKVDRATMQNALEGREPFLDHKIIEFALGLPDHMKLRLGETKWILRQILYKYLPKEMMERPKMGFGIPLDRWLSSFLKEKLIDLKNDEIFTNAFLLDKTRLNSLIDKYLAKKSQSTYLIWYLFCLHQWYLKWIK
jgi:asparagine synthase (glutamine-hydrolysing)